MILWSQSTIAATYTFKSDSKPLIQQTFMYQFVPGAGDTTVNRETCQANNQLLNCLCTARISPIKDKYRVPGAYLTGRPCLVRESGKASLRSNNGTEL